MRRLLARCAIVAAGALGGCDSDPAGSVDARADAFADAVDTHEAAPAMHAVVIQDLWDGYCAGPGRSRGADIDAVELVPGGAGASVFLGEVVGEVPASTSPTPPSTDPCLNDYDQLDAALGPPDATTLFPDADTQFVSLHGGWLAGIFQGAPRIEVGDRLVVHEVGRNVGGNADSDEPFALLLMTDLDCAGPSDASCSFKVGEGYGVASFDLEAMPF